MTGRHTLIEVRRNPAHELRGSSLRAAQGQFERTGEAIAVVEPMPEVCEAAAEIGGVTGARTLDALHLGAARTAVGGTLPFVTFDLRQAQVARALGWVVLGSCRGGVRSPAGCGIIL